VSEIVVISAEEVRQLATEMMKPQIGFEPLTLRKGTVQSIEAGSPPTLTLLVSGDTTAPVPGVTFMDSYSPVVGDTVLVGRQGKDIFVLGIVRAETPRSQPSCGGAVRSNDVTGINTTETEAMTAPSVDLEANSTYRVTAYFSWYTSGADTAAHFRIRNASVGGTALAQTISRKADEGSVPYSQTLTYIYKTTTAEANRVFVATVVRRLGTNDIFISGGSYIETTRLGSSTDIASLS
jgi:hypothetical protein